ncbi:MAG TPA: LptA/OstA family protein [Desulfomonilia bacterium]|nr:LptA/OstA family protein [Desulfomonilia bacterium]
MPYALHAEGLKTPPKASDMVDIEADRLDVNTMNGTAIFRGKVKATKPDITVKGNTLTLNYDQKSHKVTLLTAEGDVDIIWKDKEATCKKAVYNLASDVMVLTGDAVIVRGQEHVSGQKITLDKKNDTQIVEGEGGRVKVRVNAGESTGIMQWGK